MSAAVRELVYALRSLEKRPAVCAAAVASIALAVGATSVLTGIVYTLLYRPPAHVREPADLARVLFSQADTQTPRASFPTYELLRDTLRPACDLAAYATKVVVMGRGAAAREATIQLVTPNYFAVLGTRPASGAFFVPGEGPAGHAADVVISHAYWQAAFAGASDVIGQRVAIGNRFFTIVAVAPRGFSGIDRTRVDAWLSIRAATEIIDPASLTSPTLYWMTLVGRVAADARIGSGVQASSALRAAQGELAQYDPTTVVFHPLLGDGSPGRPEKQQVRLMGWLTAASGMLLLIASANVANLMLVRIVGSAREFMTRAALGASLRRLVVQVELELAVIVVLGAAGGAALVALVGEAARALLVPGLEIPSDPVSALQQIAIISFAAGVLCGIPVFVGVRRTMNISGHAGLSTARASHRHLSFLIVVQCAIVVVLLIGAGLFSRSLRNVTGLDLGLDAGNLLYASADLETDLSLADTLALYRTLAERVSRIPGVTGVTMAMGLPLRNVWAVAVTMPGDVWAGPNPVALGHAVGPDYFQVTGLGITRGRGFDQSDHSPPARVAVINEAFARAYWPTRDPLGACLQLGSETQCTRIVGVAVDTPRWSIVATRELEIYVPLKRDGFGLKPTLALAIRSPDPTSIVGPVRTVMQSTSAHISYAPVTTLAAILEPQIRPWKLGATIFSSFSIVALVLSGIGLYGLLAFVVIRQRHAIGIRMALGETPAMVRRTIFVRGCALTAIGGVAGVLAAIVLAPAIESMLFGVTARDPLVFAGAAVSVFVIAGVASYDPGRRASLCDCATLLRSN